MTTDIDAIMRAILEEPHDNLHRLAYADLLEEHGLDDYAEFIRLQIEKALQSYHYKLPERVVEACKDREATLARELCQCGVFDSPVVVRRTWSRGFVCGIDLSLQAFMAHAREFFLWQPITEVHLTDRKPFHEPDDDYSWWYEVCDDISDEDQSDLPSELFVCFGVDEWYIAFSTFADAMQALSTACVRYGRQQAGLPELKHHRTPNP